MASPSLLSLPKLNMALLEASDLVANTAASGLSALLVLLESDATDPNVKPVPDAGAGAALPVPVGEVKLKLAVAPLPLEEAEPDPVFKKSNEPPVVAAPAAGALKPPNPAKILGPPSFKR